MTAVATCPVCQLQLSVPDEVDSDSLARCPVCRSTFVLTDAKIAPVLPLIVVPKSTHDSARAGAASGRDEHESEFRLADESQHIDAPSELAEPSEPMTALAGPDPEPLFTDESPASQQCEDELPLSDEFHADQEYQATPEDQEVDSQPAVSHLPDHQDDSWHEQSAGSALPIADGATEPSDDPNLDPQDSEQWRSAECTAELAAGDLPEFEEHAQLADAQDDDGIFVRWENNEGQAPDASSSPKDEHPEEHRDGDAADPAEQPLSSRETVVDVPDLNVDTEDSEEQTDEFTSGEGEEQNLHSTTSEGDWSAAQEYVESASDETSAIQGGGEEPIAREFPQLEGTGSAEAEEFSYESQSALESEHIPVEQSSWPDPGEADADKIASDDESWQTEESAAEIDRVESDAPATAGEAGELGWDEDSWEAESRTSQENWDSEDAEPAAADGLESTPLDQGQSWMQIEENASDADWQMEEDAAADSEWTGEDTSPTAATVEYAPERRAEVEQQELPLAFEEEIPEQPDSPSDDVPPPDSRAESADQGDMGHTDLESGSPHWQNEYAEQPAEFIAEDSGASEVGQTEARPAGEEESIPDGVVPVETDLELPAAEVPLVDTPPATLDKLIDRQAEADSPEQEVLQHGDRPGGQPPLPHVPGVPRREAGGGDRSGFRTMGIVIAAVTGVAGVCGLGWWAVNNTLGGSSAQADAVSENQPGNLVDNETNPAGVVPADFQTDTGDDAPSGVRQASAAFDADSDEVGAEFASTSANASGGNSDQSGAFVRGAPSYAMDKVAEALKYAQRAQAGLIQGDLTNPEHKRVKAICYSRFCDLAEALTYFEDEPTRVGRTIMLLEAKDIFRDTLRDQEVRDDVAQLTFDWINSDYRKQNGIAGVFTAGTLTDIRRRGGVYEYQIANQAGVISFVWPERLDRKVFAKDVSVVVAGSLVDDPQRSIATYEGTSSLTIWAADVKALDRSNAPPENIRWKW